MIIKVDNNTITYALHQTLNGFIMYTSFDPIKNLVFLNEMEKKFRIIGVENSHENGSNVIKFNSLGYDKDAVAEVIRGIVEKKVCS